MGIKFRYRYILPHLPHIGGRAELPPEIVMEVPLTYPDYPWFAELGLNRNATIERKSVTSQSLLRLEFS